MNETERVREEIATLLRHFVIEYEKAWRGEPCKTPKNIAAQILKIKGLVVEADDQNMPNEGRNPRYSPDSYHAQLSYGEAQQDILKAGWRKVA